jgi:hypothetical protein
MDPGDLIAGYAAVVATVALGWQILKERRARRPQVEVKISYSLLGYPDREAAGAAHIEARTGATCRSGSPRPGSSSRMTARRSPTSLTSHPGRRSPA